MTKMAECDAPTTPTVISLSAGIVAANSEGLSAVSRSRILDEVEGSAGSCTVVGEDPVQYTTSGAVRLSTSPVLGLWIPNDHSVLLIIFC